jgi:hypothetical protein
MCLLLVFASLQGQLPKELAEFQEGLQQYDQQLKELGSEEASRVG